MWESNLRLFQTIQQSDPLLWESLTNVAKALESSGCRYIDDHDSHFGSIDDYKMDPIDHVVICQRYRADGELQISTEEDRYGEKHPVGWVFPGRFMLPTNMWWCAQCKNPLYVDDHGRPHLTTYATGPTLNKDNFDILRKYEVADQYDNWMGTSEKNFVLPTTVFIRTLLREQLKLI